MDIHKPKPFHSLREFGSEILVIITGILIALTLEQLVEQWHWHEQVEGAEHALGEELSEAYGQGLERIAVSNCIDRRLDAIEAIVEASATGGRLPPVGDLGTPPIRTWSNGTWESTLAGQTGERMPTARRNMYSVIYGFVDRLSADNQRELEVWARLYRIVGPGRPVSAAEIDSLREDVGQARLLNQMLGLESVRVQQIADGTKVHLNRTFVDSFRTGPGDFSICHAIGAAPPHYGVSPISDAIERARRNPLGKDKAPAAVTGNFEH